MSRALPEPEPTGLLARLRALLTSWYDTADDLAHRYPRRAVGVAAALVLLLVLLLVASCGPDAEPVPQPSPTPTPTLVPEPALTPTPVPTPTPKTTYYYPGPTAGTTTAPGGIEWTDRGGGVESGCDYRTGNLLYRDTRTGAISVVPGGCSAMSSAPSAPAPTEPPAR